MEKELARARASIRNAIRSRSCINSYKQRQADAAFVPRGDVYLNPRALYQLSFIFFYFSNLQLNVISLLVLFLPQSTSASFILSNKKIIIS